MKYKNPYYKKIKKSYKLLVVCGYCKEELALYQKIGRGGLLRMYRDRIIISNINLKDCKKTLDCPSCHKMIALSSSDSKGEHYRMLRSKFNTKNI